MDYVLITLVLITIGLLYIIFATNLLNENYDESIEPLYNSDATRLESAGATGLLVAGATGLKSAEAVNTEADKFIQSIYELYDKQLELENASEQMSFNGLGSSVSTATLYTESERYVWYNLETNKLFSMRFGREVESVVADMYVYIGEL